MRDLEPAGARLTISRTIEDVQKVRELAMEKRDASGAVRMTGALARLCGYSGRRISATGETGKLPFNPANLLEAVERRFQR